MLGCFVLFCTCQSVIESRLNIHRFGKDYTCSLQYRLLLQSFTLPILFFADVNDVFHLHYNAFYNCNIFYCEGCVGVPKCLFPVFSGLVFSTTAIWCRIFMSRIFHPCHLVPYFHVSHFPPLLFSVIWCHIFMSCIFMFRIFSVPHSGVES